MFGQFEKCQYNIMQKTELLKFDPKKSWKFKWNNHLNWSWTLHFLRLVSVDEVNLMHEIYGNEIHLWVMIGKQVLEML